MTDYSFFNNGRIGLDNVDNTQRNMENTRYSSYMLSNYFAEPADNGHVNFATQQPNVMFSGTPTTLRAARGLSFQPLVRSICMEKL